MNLIEKMARADVDCWDQLSPRQQEQLKSAARKMLGPVVELLREKARASTELGGNLATNALLFAAKELEAMKEGKP